MPIITIRERMIHFAHVPKCAGTSVTTYLKNVSDSISFVDPRHFTHDKSTLWNKSSPQHIDGLSLSRLFPQRNFFNGWFAVVRNPIDRFISAFNFQITVAKSISGEADINDFAKSLNYQTITTTGFFDNHFMPMTHFFLPNTNYTVVKVENGLHHLTSWFENEILGYRTEFLIEGDTDTQNNLLNKEKYSLLEDTVLHLKEIYSNDYKAFDYN